MVLDPLCLRPNMLLKKRRRDKKGLIHARAQSVLQLGRGLCLVYLKALAAGIDEASERAPIEVVLWYNRPAEQKKKHLEIKQKEKYIDVCFFAHPCWLAPFCSPAPPCRNSVPRFSTP